MTGKVEDVLLEPSRFSETLSHSFYSIPLLLSFAYSTLSTLLVTYSVTLVPSECTKERSEAVLDFPF